MITYDDDNNSDDEDEQDEQHEDIDIFANVYKIHFKVEF